MNIAALAADLILLLHFGFVVFVVLGLLLIIVGGLLGWAWVRNGRFRLAHIAAIAFVVAQAWLGKICPLTIWEMELRREAGLRVYEGSFIAHWVGRALYYDAPPWMFILAYSVFALLVLGAWIKVPPLFAAFRR